MKLRHSKSDFKQDLKNARDYLAEAYLYLEEGNWYNYVNTMTDLEALCSASRCNAQENLDDAE